MSARAPKKIEFSTLWKETRVILERMKSEELLVYRHWSLLYNQPTMSRPERSAQEKV